MYCVYKHTSPSGKSYIGITKQKPSKRWLSDGRGYQGNEYFFRAIVKYGWDNFKHEILFDGLSKEEACKKEIELIATYKSNNPDFGYNHSSGGENAGAGVHQVRSDESKRKQSIAMTGRKQSPETIIKRALSNTGTKRTAEQRARMSKAQKGLKKANHTEEWKKEMSARYSGENNPNFGKPMSKEQKQKISEHTKNKKTIVQLSLNGDFIKQYPSAKQAERETGVFNGNIIACCKRKKPTMGGYVWRYADEV